MRSRGGTTSYIGSTERTAGMKQPKTTANDLMSSDGSSGPAHSSGDERVYKPNSGFNTDDEDAVMYSVGRVD